MISLLWTFPALAGNFYENEVKKERDSWDVIKINQEDKALVEGEEIDDQSSEIDSVKVVINIPEKKLRVFEGDDVLKEYSVAVGALGHPTPEREGKIKQIVWNPWWFPPTYRAWAKNAKPEPPGPKNPLGPVKMPVSGDIVVHGTNKESSVGQAASHGCMRMRNEEAKELAWFFQSHFSTENNEEKKVFYGKNRSQSFYVNLQQEIPVSIVYDRVMMINDFLEIHPDVYGRDDEQSTYRWLQHAFKEMESVGIPSWDVNQDIILASLSSKTPQKIAFKDLLQNHEKENDEVKLTNFTAQLTLEP